MKSRLLILLSTAFLLCGCSGWDQRYTSYTPYVPTSGGTSEVDPTISGSSSPLSSGESGSHSPGPVQEDFEYEIIEEEDGSYAKLTKAKLSPTLTELTIPYMVGGCPIKYAVDGLLSEFTSLEKLESSILAPKVNGNLADLFGGTLPESLTDVTFVGPILGGSFMNYPNIKHLEIYNTDAYINIRDLVNLESVYLYLLTNLSTDSLRNTPKLKTIDGEGGNYVFENNAMYNKDKTILCRAIIDENATTYVAPESVTNIRQEAIQDRPNLKEITYYNNNSNDIYPFKNCPNIEKVTLNKATIALKNLCSPYPTTLKTVIILGGTTISSSFMMSNTSVTSLTLPTSINSVGSYAFYNCKGISEINLANATSFGSYALSGCTANIIRGNNVITYGDYSFANSTITSLTISSTSTSIGVGAFSGCTSLSTINFTVSGISSIGESAFEGCTALKNLSLPYVYSISKYAFRNCTGLQTLSIDSSTKTIEEEAFKGCSALTSINFNSASLTIGKSAFASCPNITSISNGDEVKSLATNCFNGSATNITTVSFAKATLAGGVFASMNKLATLTVGSTSVRIGYLFTQTSSTYTINYSDSNTGYAPNSLKTLNIRSDNVINSYFGQGLTSLTTLTLPDGLKTLESNSLSNCKNITRLDLPVGITDIKSYALTGLENCKYVDSHYENDNDHKFRTLTLYTTCFSSKKLEWFVLPCGNKAAYQTNAIFMPADISTTPAFYVGVIPTTWTWNENWISQSTGRKVYTNYSDSKVSDYWHYVDGVPTPW